jgi:hypothetical protein
VSHSAVPVFRRTIEITHRAKATSGCVRVALEDDYHHFLVQVDYADNRVSRATGEALRTPYTACSGATSILAQLHGMPLSTNSIAVSRYGDQRQHCTHMLDEAGLAIAAAAAGTEHRRYDVEVPRHVNGVTHPRLWRDGEPLLEWAVNDNVIESPAPFDSLPLGAGMSRWVQENLDPDNAEAALVLRRCAMIALGRLRNLDLEVHARSSGHCYAQQPHRAKNALRVKGSTLDFSDNRDKLISSDRSWLDQLTTGK